MEQATTSTVHIDNSLIRERLDNIMKGSHILFQNVNPFLPTVFEPSQSIKMKAKFSANYKIPENKIVIPQSTRAYPRLEENLIVSKDNNSATPLLLKDSTSGGIENRLVVAGSTSTSSNQNKPPTTSNALTTVPSAQNTSSTTTSSSSALVMKREPVKIPTPKWHAPWELSAVVSGHLGWVRSIAFDPSNEWFATGSADRTIKIWDLAKCCAGVEGGLKLTLTGHINAIRGLTVSNRHPYLFSVGEDKLVNCWDLEYNKIIRNYHGHLSAVFCCAMHPTLDLLITGGRDSVARVWDIRTKHQIVVLGGHTDAVSSIITNTINPQIITSSHDSTIKLWDLAAGKTMSTLTHHKKAVRCITASTKELTFVSGSADNIKKWQIRDGKFLKNYTGHNSVINCVSNNDDGVLVSAADNGSLYFWDYDTGYNFQSTKTIVQPGSLDAESGIFAMSFDLSGTRLLTCEADKSIKIWKENDNETEDSYPIDMQAWSKKCLALKRF